MAEVMTNSNSNKIGTVGTSFGAVNTQITTPGIYAWNFNNLNYTSTLFFIVSSDLGKVTLLNETWFSKNITFAKNDEGYLTVTYTGANATVLFTRIAGV